MSFWTIGTDIIQLVNNIGIAITQIGTVIFQTFLSIILALWYPVGVTIFFFQTEWAYLYSIFAALINAIIMTVNLPITLMLVMFATLPPEWMALFYLSLLIALAIRAYRWIKEAKGWIPLMGGGD